MADFRVIVTGSRGWRDYDRLVHELAYVARWCSGGAPLFVHGDASSGADLLTRKACDAQGWAQEPHPADWDTCSWPGCKPGHRRKRRDGTTYCPAAGNFRNQQMCDAGGVAGVAFMMPCPNPACGRRGVHNSHGTADCIERLGSALIPVWAVAEGCRASWIGLDERERADG